MVLHRKSIITQPDAPYFPLLLHRCSLVFFDTRGCVTSLRDLLQPANSMQLKYQVCRRT